MIKLSSFKNYKILLFCISIFIFSFFVRVLHGSRFVIFGQDQARDAYLMRQLEVSKIWIVNLGPKASVGNFYLPPLYYQVHNIVSRATGENPLAMMWLIIFIESFTPIILFLWLCMVVEKRAAMLGAYVYAFSAGVIEYATFAWNPNMIPFFSTVLGFCCFLIIFKKIKMAIPVAVFALCVAVSLHFQAIVLVPFVLITFFISLKQDFRNLTYWLLGSMFSSLMFVPYVQGELASDWQNTRGMLSFFHENNTRYFDRVSKPVFIFVFFPSLIERVLLLKNVYLNLFGTLLFFGGILQAISSAIRHKSREKIAILIYFFCIFFDAASI
jgi:hypothetical protein